MFYSCKRAQLQTSLPSPRTALANCIILIDIWVNKRRQR